MSEQPRTGAVRVWARHAAQATDAPASDAHVGASVVPDVYHDALDFRNLDDDTCRISAGRRGGGWQRGGRVPCVLRPFATTATTAKKRCGLYATAEAAERFSRGREVSCATRAWRTRRCGSNCTSSNGIVDDGWRSIQWSTRCGYLVLALGGHRRRGCPARSRHIARSAGHRAVVNTPPVWRRKLAKVGKNVTEASAATTTTTTTAKMR